MHNTVRAYKGKMLMEPYRTVKKFAWVPSRLYGRVVWLKFYGVHQVWFPKRGKVAKWHWFTLRYSGFAISQG